jgi:hypothetical protein
MLSIFPVELELWDPKATSYQDDFFQFVRLFKDRSSFSQRQILGNLTSWIATSESMVGRLLCEVGSFEG